MITFNFDRAKEILNECERFESRDHYFGDREVYWTLNGEEIAEGYFSSEGSEVSLNLDVNDRIFYGEQARELAKCGKVVNIGRNDEVGPDEYRGA